MVSFGVQHTPSAEHPGGSSAQADTPMMAIEAALQHWRAVVSADRGFLITTDCLYPSRRSVVVVVIGAQRGQSAVVHDDGGALEELVIAGRSTWRAPAIIRRIAHRYGLEGADGAITSRPSPVGDLSALIPLVANASQEAATALLNTSSPRAQRDLRAEITRAVRARLPDAELLKEYSVAGISARQYRFDVAVPLRGKTLLVDIARPDASSVNAAYVANLDVGRRQDAKFVQTIVFDPAEQSRFGGGLSLLAEVADTLPIENLPGALEKLAA